MSGVLLQSYALRIRELRRANPDVPETGLAPAFQQLLEGLIALLLAAPRLTVVPEYRNPGVGRPDIALIRQGTPARAFVELKAQTNPLILRDGVLKTSVSTSGSRNCVVGQRAISPSFVCFTAMTKSVVRRSCLNAAFAPIKMTRVRTVLSPRTTPELSFG